MLSPVADGAGGKGPGVFRHAQPPRRDPARKALAEEALARSEERHRAVVAQISEGIYLIEAESGRILESNPALERMLGYTTGELAGMVIYDLIAHDRRSVEANLGRTADGQRFVGERRYRRKDGTLIDVEVGASVISYGRGEAVCAVVRDVSGRKKTERAAAGIREAERQRIARDLHDTVLQDLAAALQTLQADQVEGAKDTASPGVRAPGTGSRHAIDALRRAIRGLRAAVHDLRPEKERPFVRLLESLVEMNRRLAPGCEFGLTVADGSPPDLPQDQKVELTRIVQEALANARRHSGAGRIQTTLVVAAGSVQVEVTDDGGGFVPGEAQGGVGLSAMRERALAAGGEYELRTGPGRGTRVTVRVPLQEAYPGCDAGSSRLTRPSRIA